MSVLVFAEQRGGELRKVAFEATSQGRRVATALGKELTVALLGQNIGNLAEGLSKYGAGKVVVADHPELTYYSTEGYVYVLKKIVDSVNPSVIIISASAMGKDLAPRLAAKLDVPLFSDITAMTTENAAITITRPIFAGKVFLTATTKANPVMVTIRPKVFAPEVLDGGGISAEPFAVEIPEGTIKARVTELKVESGGKVDLTEADVIVSGGRGMKGPENFGLIEQLAEALGGTDGASRAVVDAGWRPYSKQVGQTGKTVSPTLYIACGISGAVQHLAGMSSSKYIVAINKDPDAPIFKVASWGIVGDALQILPELIKAVKET
jgi:electron transfer flavoprotein alpha subunit